MEEKDSKDLPSLPVLSQGAETPANGNGTIMTGLKGKMRSVYPGTQNSGGSRIKKFAGYAVVATLVVIGMSRKAYLRTV
jgi:hypothetical protein